jgi:hypothetical protein
MRPTSRENNLRARLGNGPKPKMVHRPARARRVPRSRPQPGPGPGKTHPAWAESRSGVCEPSISIRRSRAVFGRTKPASSPVAQNPSLISVFLRSLSRAAAATPSDRAAPERARPRRRPSPSSVCARSPLGERAAVEWPQRRFFAPACPDDAVSSAPSRSRRRRRSRGGAPVRSRARPHAGERWSGSTRASRRSTTRGSADDGGREEIRVRTLAPLFFFPFSFPFFFLSFFFYPGHGEAV